MKILVVCGNGLGSSFIMELNVKKALNELGKEAEVGHTDLATAVRKRRIFISERKILFHNLMMEPATLSHWKM